MQEQKRIWLQAPESGSHSFLFLPKIAHVLQSLALRFGNKLPNKHGSKDTDDTIQTVCKHMAELIAHIARAHVVKRKESGRNDKVENPLKGYSDCNSGSTDGVRENL